MKIDNEVVLKKLFDRQKNNVDTLINDYLRTESYKVRKPKAPSPHVGIEVECFGPMKSDKLQKLLFMMDLEKVVQIGRDGSIRPPRGNWEYELRILLTERNLSPMLKKIGKFFKEAKLKVNDTCGLHVHLDMRHRKAIPCYNKLLKFQDVLYGLVHKKRWSNQYCQYATNWMRSDKYRAITCSSLSSKRTIEVRLHHGTVDVNTIEKWIRLLINVINRPELQKAPRTREEILKWKGLRRDVKPYLKDKLKDDWFKKKRDEEARDAKMGSILASTSSIAPNSVTYGVVRRPNGAA